MQIRCLPGIIAAALVLGLAGPLHAGYVTDTLGCAGPSHYAVLALSGATDIALNGPGTTNGNVGIVSPKCCGVANLQLNSSNGNPSVAINGNLYLGNSATVNNTAQVNGTVYTNQNALLNHANTDALNASAAFAKLTPTLTVPGGAVNGTTTINGTAGINVVKLCSINLGNGQSLTLNGPAGSQFVVNVTGNNALKINGPAQLALSGGLTPSDVVYNFTGTGQLQTSGGLHNNLSVLNGVILAPNASIGFAPGKVNGELIAGGQQLHLVSGASVCQPPPGNVVPPPPSLVLMGLGGLAFLGTMLRAATAWVRGVTSVPVGIVRWMQWTDPARPPRTTRTPTRCSTCCGRPRRGGRSSWNANRRPCANATA